MVLGESVNVQEGSVLIPLSLYFNMEGHEWMNGVHCLKVMWLWLREMDGGIIANALVEGGMRDVVCVRRLEKLKRIAMTNTEGRGKGSVFLIMCCD